MRSKYNKVEHTASRYSQHRLQERVAFGDRTIQLGPYLYHDLYARTHPGFSVPPQVMGMYYWVVRQMNPEGDSAQPLWDWRTNEDCGRPVFDH